MFQYRALAHMRASESKDVISRSRWTTLAATAFIGTLFVLSFLSAFLSNTQLDSESAILSNVLIEYASHGILAYPFHAQDLYYPGVDKFVMHPPLHYLISAMWVKTFGVGIWQILLQSVAVSLMGTIALGAL